MTEITASDVCRALREDSSPRSGWMRECGTIIEPRTELFLDVGIWVRANGRLVSGWLGPLHVHRYFGPLSAYRIRRAVRRWANSKDAHQ